MSENRRIARAAGLVGALTLGSRVTGLLRDMAIGYVFGTGPAADAFFVAFRLPNLLRRFVSEGAMSVAYIPIFADYLAHRTRAEAVDALRALAGAFAAGLAALTLGGIAFAPQWLAVLAPGFAAEPEQIALTVQLARWLFAYIFLVGMVALFGGFLNALRHFAAPALSPVLLNAAMIAGALWLAPRLSVPIFGVAAGVLAGGLLQLVLQLWPLRRRGIQPVPTWRPSHPAVRRVLRLLAPTALGAAMYQINVLIGTSLASMLASGSVSFLWYAGRVFEFPIGLVAVALGTAALPSFAAQAARGAHDEMRRSLTFALAATSYIAVPASLAFVLLAEPIVTVLFRHGAFGAAEVTLTARALQAYAIGLWPLSVVRVVAPAFYAMHDARTPLWAAGAAFVVNTVLSLMLIGPVAGDPSSFIVGAIARVTGAVAVCDLGHVGLALAASFAAAANAALLGVAVVRRLGGIDVAAVRAAALRSGAASAPMTLVVAALSGAADWTLPGRTLPQAGWLAVVIAAGLVTYAVAALALGGTQVRALRRALNEAIAARRRG